MANKKALITGILGQDGSYMAELLAGKGYYVHGIVKPETSEDRMLWLKTSIPNVKIWKIDILNNFHLSYVIQNSHPDEIYNFAGISNTFNAWEFIDSTTKLNSTVPQNILEIINAFNKNIKFFQASSCLIYGRDTSELQNENTPPKPIYPYGISKLYADNMVKEFRESFGLFACSGIFFPHESPRRGDDFFVKKITNAVKNKQKVKVGNIGLMREYGYAPEYVNAAYMMMQAPIPTDYVIGTGNPILLSEFVNKCFSYAGLDYKDYIEQDNTLFRQINIPTLKADSRKISKELNWNPVVNIDELIKIMIE